MTSLSYQVKSSSSLASKKWRLKVKIDGPGSYRMPAAYVLVVKRKGTDKHFVRLNRKGNGQVIVPFGRKQVKSVYVSLVNASTRFKCGRSTPSPARACPSTTVAASGASPTSSARRSSNAADHVSSRYAESVAARRHRDGGGGLGRSAGARGRVVTGWAPTSAEATSSARCPTTSTGPSVTGSSPPTACPTWASWSPAWRWPGGRASPGCSATCCRGCAGLPTAYAVVTVLLGPASAAMHATGSELGGHLDLLSMYLVASFAAAYALMRLVGQGAVFFFQVFSMMVAACELVGTHRRRGARRAHRRQPRLRRAAGHRDRRRGACSGAAPRACPAATRTDLRWGGGAVAAMALAFVIWNLAQGPWCDPTSWLQGHAAWHLLVRGGGVPAVPALRERAGHGSVAIGCGAVTIGRRPWIGDASASLRSGHECERLRLLDRRLGRVRPAGQAGRPQHHHADVRRAVGGHGPRALARQRWRRGSQHQRLRRLARAAGTRPGWTPLAACCCSTAGCGTARW